MSDVTFEVETETTKKGRKQGGGGGGSDGPKPQPDPENPIPEILTEQKVLDVKEEPAVSRIQLQRASNEDLEGALCRMQVLSDAERHFVIEVNKDHTVVVDLLTERPVKKEALHLMLTREIAAALLTSEPVAKRVLPEAIWTKLNGLDTPLGRERLLARILFDKAKRPVVDSEAA